jgi:bile acid:Na+ symporter, BASS family
MMNTLQRGALWGSGAALLALVALLASGQTAFWPMVAISAAVLFSVGLGSVPALRGFQFTGWIVAAVVAGMVAPGAFQRWGEVDLRNKWVILLVIQMVMFGMGTQMRLHDFGGMLKTPGALVIGLLCQFTVMPLTGWALTKVIPFPPEIAAGVILIGCCSSGLSSNVMAYLAKANLALSVTVTAVTTMVAPFVTPLLMKLLAGTLVEIRFSQMMIEIVKMVIVPIGAALLHDYLKAASPRGRKITYGVAAVAAVWFAWLALGGWITVSGQLSPVGAEIVSLCGFLLGAVVAGVIYHHVANALPVVPRWMPFASMAGIVYFTTVTTAAGRDNLLQVGLWLFLACVIHNATGYTLGYWLSRGLGLDKASCRAVAFEVGLQNGGMASGLAGGMGKLATMGLAAAIFSPWMNISGSVLANYWRRKTEREESIN